jgi:hypothetical protein
MGHCGYSTTHYCGCWLIFKTSFWQGDAVLAYTEEWDRTFNNYKHRTMEQVVNADILGLLVPRAALHQFGGFGLKHDQDSVLFANPELRLLECDR